MNIINYLIYCKRPDIHNPVNIRMYMWWPENWISLFSIWIQPTDRIIDIRIDYRYAMWFIRYLRFIIVIICVVINSLKLRRHNVHSIQLNTIINTVICRINSNKIYKSMSWIGDKTSRLKQYNCHIWPFIDAWNLYKKWITHWIDASILNKT
jgi:hypothetical protein